MVKAGRRMGQSGRGLAEMNPWDSHFPSEFAEVVAASMVLDSDPMAYSANCKAITPGCTFIGPYSCDTMPATHLFCCAP